jgi:hypothetical protein
MPMPHNLGAVAVIPDRPQDPLDHDQIGVPFSYGDSFQQDLAAPALLVFDNTWPRVSERQHFSTEPTVKGLPSDTIDIKAYLFPRFAAAEKQVCLIRFNAAAWSRLGSSARVSALKASSHAADA